MEFIENAPDNIINDVNHANHAISAIDTVSDEDIDVFIANIFKLNAKFKTLEEIKKYNAHLTQLVNIYTREIEKNIRTNIDEIFNNIQKLEKLKDKIKQLIDGTFECIKINMNNPDFDITLPINTFSDENLKKLLDKGLITNDIYQEELEWRQINKDYQSNETKQIYIQELDKKISMNKEEIINNINKNFRINIIKQKIYIIRHIIFSNNNLVDYYNKYNIDSSYPPMFGNLFGKLFNQMSEPVQVSEPILVSEPVQVSEPILVSEPIIVSEPILVSEPVMDECPPPQMLEQTQKRIPRPMTPPLRVLNSPKEIKKSMTPPPRVMEQPLENTPKEIKKSITSSPVPYFVASDVSLPASQNIAPTDLYLEKFCYYGKTCANIDDPSKCGFNHTVIGTPVHDKYNSNKINKGDVIPREFCRNEKPWEGTNSRCHNINCTFVHCIGRVNFLRKNYKPNTNEPEPERKRKRDDYDTPEYNPPKSKASSPEPVRNLHKTTAPLPVYEPPQPVRNPPLPMFNPPRPMYNPPLPVYNPYYYNPYYNQNDLRNVIANKRQ